MQIPPLGHPSAPRQPAGVHRAIHPWPVQARKGGDAGDLAGLAAHAQSGSGKCGRIASPSGRGLQEQAEIPLKPSVKAAAQCANPSCLRRRAAPLRRAAQLPTGCRRRKPEARNHKPTKALDLAGKNPCLAPNIAPKRPDSPVCASSCVAASRQDDLGVDRPPAACLCSPLNQCASARVGLLAEYHSQPIAGE